LLTGAQPQRERERYKLDELRERERYKLDELRERERYKPDELHDVLCADLLLMADVKNGALEITGNAPGRRALEGRMWRQKRAVRRHCSLSS
jgi:hypothetical protein